MPPLIVEPPPGPIGLRAPKDDNVRELAPSPPDIEDIPPEIGERLNEVRMVPIEGVPRDWKERLPLPPMR